METVALLILALVVVPMARFGVGRDYGRQEWAKQEAEMCAEIEALLAEIAELKRRLGDEDEVA